MEQMREQNMVLLGDVFVQKMYNNTVFYSVFWLKLHENLSFVWPQLFRPGRQGLEGIQKK